MLTESCPKNRDFEVFMYSREVKLKAVKLYIQYDFSPASVINELGNPLFRH